LLRSSFRFLQNLTRKNCTPSRRVGIFWSTVGGTIRGYYDVLARMPSPSCIADANHFFREQPKALGQE